MTTATILIHESAANHIDRVIGHYTPSGTKWHDGLRRRRVSAEQANAALVTLRGALATIDPAASVHSMRHAQALNGAARELKRVIAKLSA
jgi:hypothetical protein